MFLEVGEPIRGTTHFCHSGQYLRCEDGRVEEEGQSRIECNFQKKERSLESNTQRVSRSGGGKCDFRRRCRGQRGEMEAKKEDERSDVLWGILLHESEDINSSTYPN